VTVRLVADNTRPVRRVRAGTVPEDTAYHPPINLGEPAEDGCGDMGGAVRAALIFIAAVAVVAAAGFFIAQRQPSVDVAEVWAPHK